MRTMQQRKYGLTNRQPQKFDPLDKNSNLDKMQQARERLTLDQSEYFARFMLVALSNSVSPEIWNQCLSHSVDMVKRVFPQEQTA